MLEPWLAECEVLAQRFLVTFDGRWLSEVKSWFTKNRCVLRRDVMRKQKYI
jgi:hypothetical protein